jgi:hypothetical protein
MSLSVANIPSLLISLVLAVGLSGCIGLGYVPSREISVLPPGKHEAVSLSVQLPKRAHSWEVGLWPSPTATNATDFVGRHLKAEVTNESDQPLVLSPGVRSPFDRPLTLAPGATAVVHDEAVIGAPELLRLFGCDTQYRLASFKLALHFEPAVVTRTPTDILAQGRDAL